jgi:hypothetical protein
MQLFRQVIIAEPNTLQGKYIMTASINPTSTANSTNQALWPAIIPFIPLINGLVTTVLGGIIVYGITKSTEGNIRSGDFDRAMSPQGKDEAKAKSEEINRYVALIKDAESRNDSSTAKSLRQQLSNAYTDLAGIYTRESAHIIRSNPSLAGATKDLIQALQGTSQEVLKPNTPLSPQAQNPATDDNLALLNAIDKVMPGLTAEQRAAIATEYTVATRAKSSQNTAGQSELPIASNSSGRNSGR